MLTGCAANVAPQPGDDGRSGDETPARRTPDDHGPVGSAGRALLGGAIDAVVVEIDDTGDPRLRTAGPLERALREHGRKGRVSLAGDSELPSQEVYSQRDLRTFAERFRDARSTPDRVALHVLVLPGRYENADALGVAFDATSFAIFPERIREGLLPTLSYDRFEEAVLVHELGHLFGLVNLTGKGAFHEDPENEGHSRNTESVMYWAVEDVSIANVFRGGPPTRFDADDEEEMSRIRG